MSASLFFGSIFCSLHCFAHHPNKRKKKLARYMRWLRVLLEKFAIHKIYSTASISTSIAFPVPLPSSYYSNVCRFAITSASISVPKILNFSILFGSIFPWRMCNRNKIKNNNTWPRHSGSVWQYQNISRCICINKHSNIHRTQIYTKYST